MKTTLFTDCEVSDRKDFEKAGIQLFQHCYDLLAAKGLRVVAFKAGHGRARLANLLSWQVDECLEYLDGDDLTTDQVVHFGLHQFAHHRLGSKHPHAVLFAETLASSADIYLLGKLAQAGMEPDFIHETLESFGFYYETYGDDAGHMEQLLSDLTTDPFGAMVTVGNYLFNFCTPLLYPASSDEPANILAVLQPHAYYPLVHHYNVTNWVLAIRAQFPEPMGSNPGLEAFRADVLQDETGFLQTIETASKES
ncbi:MAG: hypothetical protein QNK37_37140 [Acidobacteriota bacterium]|nr:hypothetical protein [Acidobacteriota bacterium]